ncbi:MAG: acylphosphatase [Planctomycetes bacterium]|nr:acylphosphatase [Planctomycetota bacterium]
MNGSHETIRRRVNYGGRVQGVGFRVTTAGLARNRPVTGYVRNLADGTVEVVAEGRPQDVERFLAEVASMFGRYIRDVRESEAAADETFTSFDVRH